MGVEIAELEMRVKATGVEVARGQLKQMRQEGAAAAKTWTQFVGERMGPYMKELGSHGAAIKRIGEEWKAYKNAAQSAGQATTQAGTAATSAAQGAQTLSDAYKVTQQGMIGAAAAARSLAGVLGVTLGAAGIVQYARNVMNTADHLGDLADQTGLSMKALIGLRQVTAPAGVSIDEFAQGVRFMMRNLAEAADQTGNQAQALRKLGLSTKDVLGFMSDPEGFLTTFAKKLAALPTHAERLAVAQELAGRGGTRLAGVLLSIAQNGLPAVSAETERAYKKLSEFGDWMAVKAVKAADLFAAAMGKVAKSMGIGLSSKELEFQLQQLRGATGQDVAAIRALEQRLSVVRAEEAAEAAKAKGGAPAAIGLDPAKLQVATDALKKQITALQAQRIEMVEGAQAALKFKLTQDLLSELKIKTLPADLQALVSQVLAIAAALEKTKFEQERLNEVTRRYDQDLAETAQTAQETWALITRPIQDAIDKFNELRQAEAAAMFDQDFAELAGGFVDQGKASGIFKAQDDLTKRLRTIDQEAALFGAGIDAATLKINALKDAARQLIEQGLDPLDPALQDIRGQVEQLEGIQTIEQMIRSAGSGISDTLRGVRQGTQSLGEAFKNMALSAVTALADLAFQLLVIEPLIKRVRDLLSQPGAGGGGGGGGGFNFGGILGGLTGGFDLGSLFVPGGTFGPSLNLAGGFYHEGGLITVNGQRSTVNGFRMHSGGEVPVIAQEGEFMIRRPAVRRVGTRALSEINETGQMPAPVINVVEEINILGTVTPNPGVSRSEVVQIVRHVVPDDIRNRKGPITRAIREMR